MIKLKYSVMALLMSCLTMTALADNPIFKKELTKSIHKTFDVSDDVLVGVSSRYGNIKIQTWQRNEVEVDVLIKVKCNNTNKGQQFLDGVDIDFSSTGSTVGMKTTYPDQENASWWSSWWNNSQNINFEVHYDIKAPVGMSSELINKYGNIFQEPITGDCNVVNKYGDISLESVHDLELDLGYGKAQLGSANNVNIEIKYSSLTLQDCDDISIESKYSDFNLGNVGNLILSTKYDGYTITSAKRVNYNGKYDDLKIGKVHYISVETKNTDIRIQELSNGGAFDSKYGSVRVTKMGSFKNINIDSKYTDYRFGIDGDFHLNFYGEYADLDIKEPYQKYHTKKDGNSLETKIYRGNKESNSQINCEMKYGSLKLNK